MKIFGTSFSLGGGEDKIRGSVVSCVI